MIDRHGIVELIMQYRREKLVDSFDINETIQGIQILNKTVKLFVVLLKLFQFADETFFLQFLNDMEKTNTILQTVFKQVEKKHELTSF